MMVVVKKVTCEIKISLGLPASIHTLQSSSTSSQSDFSKMHTPGLLGPTELPTAPSKKPHILSGVIRPCLALHFCRDLSALSSSRPCCVLLFFTGSFSLTSGPKCRLSPLSQALTPTPDYPSRINGNLTASGKLSRTSQVIIVLITLPFLPLRTLRITLMIYSVHVHRHTRPQTVSICHVTHVPRTVPGSEYILNKGTNSSCPSPRLFCN